MLSLIGHGWSELPRVGAIDLHGAVGQTAAPYAGCASTLHLSGFPPQLQWLAGHYADTGQAREGRVVYKLADFPADVFFSFLRCSIFEAWCIVSTPDCDGAIALCYGVTFTPENPFYHKQTMWDVRAQKSWMAYDADKGTEFFYPVRLGVTAPRSPCGVPRAGRASFSAQQADGGWAANDSRFDLESLGHWSLQKQTFRGKAGECWAPGFHPKLCCQPPGGFSTCFNSLFSFERCCGALWSREPAPVEASHTVGKAPRPVDQDEFQVDLLVRAFHGDAVPLKMLLESVAIFWPIKRWRSQVLVVLDRESEADHAMCSTLPGFVTCHFEAVDDALANLAGVNRAMWSLFYADHYSTADYVAIVDPDVVFFTFGIPDLIFEWDAARPRPIMFASWTVFYILNSMVLGLDWVAEFMDTYPFVMHRRHFAPIRKFIVASMGAADFEAAFVRMIERLEHLHWQLEWWKDGAMRAENPSFHHLAGRILWELFHGEYFWSVAYGAQLGVPPGDSCPSLHVALHLQANKTRNPGLPNTHMYRARAYAHIADGLGGSPDDLLPALFSSTSRTRHHDSKYWHKASTTPCTGRTPERLLDAYAKLDMRAERAAAAKLIPSL